MELMGIEIQYIAGPLVGAVIGYITNDIAIRMLFRPHKPKYIFGIHVPFTPGIIPKEKGRIAEAIGKSVSENLMNREVMERNLLSEDMIAKIEQSFDEFVTRQKNNEESLQSFVCRYLTPEEYQTVKDSITGEFGNIVCKKMADKAMGETVAAMIVQHIVEKTQNSILGIMGGDHIAQMLEEPTRKFLAKHINDMLSSHSEEIFSSLISNEIDKVSDARICDILNGKDDRINEARQNIISVYKTIITDHLPRILNTVDISTIVRERINEMDMNEAEKIILEVMDKELKAVVWLGALLGFIMGFMNVIAKLIG